jgi:hypothetical protein
MTENSTRRWIAPDIRVFGGSVCAFRVCGSIGLGCAISLAAALSDWRGLSMPAMAGIALAAILVFLLMATVTKLVTGEEPLTYYHHEIAVLGAAALLLRLAHLAVLPYLDATILCVGMFLGCGRLGCLMAGCCHGRPCQWGVRYGVDHVGAGFPRYLAGVRLFPIQAVEALTVICTVMAGTVLVLKSGPPGAALAMYVSAYGLARFCFEFARGDPDRHYLFGFSEAQWTSVLSMLCALWMEARGLLPFQLWHRWCAVATTAIMLAVAVRRRFGSAPNYEILHPDHVRELAAALDTLSLADHSRGQAVPAAIRTSAGIRVSRGRIGICGAWMDSYGFSRESPALTEAAAATLARLVCQLGRHSGSHELIEGRWNVFHLLVRLDTENRMGTAVAARPEEIKRKAAVCAPAPEESLRLEGPTVSRTWIVEKYRID